MFHAGRTTRSGWCGIFFSVIWVCAATAGCSAYPRLKLSEITASDKLEIIPSVPFFPQTENQCGPAALAGVLASAGLPVSPETLSAQVYLPAREGSLQVELLAATRRAGLIPFIIPEVPRALVDELEAGRPVLVFQNLRTQLFPVWHYAVLVGIDPEANKLYLNSGTREGLAIGARSFLRTWNWAGRWAMVALPAGKFPANPEPLQYAEAVAAFEAVAGFEASRPAWQAAVARWPADSRAYLALGNGFYGQGDLAAAVRQYRLGLEVNALEPGLNNNMASVLGELGCPRTGEAQLRLVLDHLAADSVWRAAIEATLAELAALPGTDPQTCAEFSR